MMLILSPQLLEISQDTCMTPDDIVVTLHLLDMLVKNEDGEYVIRVNHRLVQEYMERYASKGHATVSEELVQWTPMLSLHLLDTSLA